MKMFPIKHSWFPKHKHSAADTPAYISWDEAERAYAEYCRRETGDISTLETLEAIANGGGFSAHEMDSLLPGWEERHAGRSVPSERAEQPMLQVEISWNNAGVASVCGNCQQYVNAYIGYEPFIAGTKTILCDDCASEGVIVGPLPEGFALFDQSGIAAEIAEAERRNPTSAVKPPRAFGPDDDIPF
jgi:hypothetical protein